MGGIGILLAGCGGFVYTTVGGNVTGLVSNDSVILKNDASYRQQVYSDGPFSFNVASNGSYVISVMQQPNQTNCTVANGSGQMSGNTPVTNVAVTCVPNMQLSGSVNGLASGSTVTLGLNDSKGTYFQSLSSTTLTSPGNTFNFTSYVVNGDTYTATVYTPPPAQFCTVSNGKGTASTSTPVAPVNVNCVTAAPIKVTVNNLASGQTMVLTDNATGAATGAASGSVTDSLLVTGTGTGTFTWSWVSGVNYNITVTTQPSGQTCTVTNGTGVIDSTNIQNGPANITVNCG